MGDQCAGTGALVWPTHLGSRAFANHHLGFDFGAQRLGDLEHLEDPKGIERILTESLEPRITIDIRPLMRPCGVV